MKVDREVTKEEKQVDEKYFLKFSTLSTIRKIQVKAPLR